jgi:phytanoyl-CoA hydroxylase
MLNKLKKKYLEDGYCVVRNLIPKKTIKEYLATFEKKIIKSKTALTLPLMNAQKLLKVDIKNNVMQSVIADIHQINLVRSDLSTLASNALKIILHDNIFKTLKVLHNENKYNLLMSMFFDQNAGTPAHCDNYYLDSMPSGNLTAAWIACENIDTRAGRFFVVPKSNHLNIKLTEEEILDPNKYEKKIYKLIKKNKFKIIAPALNIGDVLFWNSNTIHGSNKTISNVFTRKSFTAHFIPYNAKFVRNKYNQEIRSTNGFLYNKNFNCRITGSLQLTKNKSNFISRLEKNFNKQVL